MLSRALPLAASAALLLSLSACGSSSSSSAAVDDSASTPSDSTTASTSPSAGGSGSGQCTYSADPAGAAKKVNLPPSTPTVKGTVKATMITSIGRIGLSLDAAKAPCTVNSFVSLARQGFFDKTQCHRLTEAATTGIAVLQCGDPTGTGSGGPGYSFPDELTGHDHYGKGVLAMANSGPNTNGSQFFLVYGDSSALDQQPNYTVFGSVDRAGVAAIAKIAAKGTDNSNGQGDGHPKVPVRISKVSIS